MVDYRNWRFLTDMNGDGSTTVSDVWLWAHSLFFYPGDLLLAGVSKFTPSIAGFFEFTPNTFGGVFSGIVSFLVWTIVYAVVVQETK